MASSHNEVEDAMRQWQSQLSDDDDVSDSDHPGDYTTRMEELFDDEDQTDDEVFVYNGVDVDTSITDYNHQLRDILGPENGVDENDDTESRADHESLATTKAGRNTDEEVYSVRAPSRILKSYFEFKHVGAGETHCPAERVR
jgi:hypothetical protein